MSAAAADPGAMGILCPGYPEVRGGVVDHSRRLVESWTRLGYQVQVEGRLGFRPEQVVARWRPGGVTGVLIEYVPFLYARYGISGSPERMATAAREAELRVTIFVHEPWVPPTRLPWLILHPLQRRQLLRLTRQADAVVTPVPAWRNLLRRPHAHVLPVGSNLGPAPEIDTAPDPVPVVFSPLASGLRWNWIGAAIEALGCDPPLRTIGVARERLAADPRTAPFYDPAWEVHPYLESELALELIARSRVGLAPFVDGATLRRTSLLTLLGAGTVVVSSRGHLFDPFFSSSPMLLASTREEFVSSVLRAFHEDDDPDARKVRRSWYRDHLDPRQLDRRLLGIVRGRRK